MFPFGADESEEEEYVTVDFEAFSRSIASRFTKVNEANTDKLVMYNRDGVINGGEFEWLWQDPPTDYKYERMKVTYFEAKPYSLEQSVRLE